MRGQGAGFRARWLAPLTSRAIENGAVWIEGGRVAWAGPYAERPPGSYKDLGDGVLLPPPVNAHAHLDFPKPSEPLARGDGFSAWARRLLAWAPADEARLRAAERNARSVAAAGTGYLFHHAEKIGTGTNFREKISPRPYFFCFAEFRGPSAVPPDGAEALAPHAPHTVPFAALSAAARFPGPVSTHLGESDEEMGLYRGEENDLAALLRERGFSRAHLAELAAAPSPVRRLEAAGLLTPRLLAVHCARLGEDDLQRLAVRGVAVVLCLRSNRAIGVGGDPDLATMRRFGMRILLGTDSLASAVDLDVRREASEVLDAFPEVSPEEAWRMLALYPGRYLEHLGEYNTGRIRRRSPPPWFFATPKAQTMEEALREALSTETFCRLPT